MKVLTQTGLTKLIQLIKSSFLSNDDVEQITTLNIDSTPTTGSTNLVTSGGVKSALDGKSATGHTHTKSQITDFPSLLALGETSATAYRGDRGKIAYDHSQTSHAPANAEANQNAFSNITVGSTTIAADSKTDTFTLTAGSNVTLTPDATNDKITIAATDTTYSSKSATSGGTDVSLVTTGEKYTWNNKLDKVNPTGTGSFSLNRKADTTIGTNSFAEGDQTEASGECSHAEGYSTTASSDYQHVQGKYNIEDSTDTYADIVGNGTEDTARSNAYALDWNGNGYFKGDVYVGCNANSSGGTKVLTEHIIETTLIGASDKLPTAAAVKNYVDSAIVDAIGGSY